MGKKKDYKEFMKMFQNGAFPMPPVPPMPFAPMPGKQNEEAEDVKEKINSQKENLKSTVKSAWTQRNDRWKATADSRREQLKQRLDYLQEVQDTFAASLPDEMPYAQMLPIDPKAFMEWMEEFQIMANEYFIAQMDSALDFYFKGQEQFFDMVTAAMDKKEDEEKDSAEEKAVKKPRTKAAPKAAAKPRTKAAPKAGAKAAPKAGAKTGTKAARKPRTKAADNAVNNAETETAESQT